jgi:hypothetical protein
MNGMPLRTQRNSNNNDSLRYGLPNPPSSHNSHYLAAHDLMPNRNRNISTPQPESLPLSSAPLFGSHRNASSSSQHDFISAAGKIKLQFHLLSDDAKVSVALNVIAYDVSIPPPYTVHIIYYVRINRQLPALFLSFPSSSCTCILLLSHIYISIIINLYALMFILSVTIFYSMYVSHLLLSIVYGIYRQVHQKFKQGVHRGVHSSSVWQDCVLAAARKYTNAQHPSLQRIGRMLQTARAVDSTWDFCLFTIENIDDSKKLP